MANLRPFRAIRYNPKKIQRLQDAISPPYDVISKSQQSQLYQAHPNNFIRLILGREKKPDNNNSNKYLRAKQAFNEWRKKKILIQDDTPAIYVYEQSFRLENKAFQRNGFIALLKLESADKGVVLPHEKTFCKPKKDRLSLLKATQANLCPVFGMYRDTNNKIEDILKKAKKMPVLATLGFEGIKNRLWKIEDADTIKNIVCLMRPKKIFIADGHHRYETACHYHKLTRKLKDLESGWIMMYFSNLYSPGLKILPTHRVIRDIDGNILKKILSLLNADFSVIKMTSSRELFSRLKSAGEKEHPFGLCLGKGKHYLLKLRKYPAVNRPGAKSSSHYLKLDTVILHKLILEKILRLKNKENNNIFYTRDEKEAIRLVEGGKYKIAFFMNPPKAAQISAIAEAAEKMPHKSTYFYPKPVSGLVINSLRKDALI